MTTGAGSSVAGYYPAGFDPAAFTPRVRQQQRDPLRFDLQTKSFPRDVNGLLITVHWVDQAVALALGVNAGDVSSQTSLGNRLRAIVRAGGPALQASVRDAIQQALAALLGRADIQVPLIDVQTPIPGRILVAVTYMNMRINPAVQRPPVVLAL